jgi:golgin subfamily A member 4
MKNTQSVEDKDRLNRQLTKKLNALDNDLNRQIVRTKRDILSRQREQQRRLFMHDQYHLRQMNHWRLQKTLDDYQKKQELLKIDLNYQHNMSLFDIETKRIKALRAHHLSMLSMTYRKDMLPLETQLQIAASTQERELNLLANDAHLDIRKTKHDIEEQTLLIEKDRLRAEHDTARAHARRKTREQIENITAQLKIAQEKLKRDIRIGEQQNRIKLAKALYEKDRQISSDDAAQERALIENDRLYAMLDHEEALFRLDHDASLQRLQRGSALDRFRIRTTYVLSSVRSKTIHATHRTDLESRQKECEHLFSVLRMFQDTRNRLRLIIRELYLLPSHPEVFKTSIGIVTRLIEDFQALSDQLIDRHKATDEAFYTSVIERLTQSRYAKKREDITRLYDQEIERIESRRQSIVDDIMKMEAEVVRLKSDTEKNRTDSQSDHASEQALQRQKAPRTRHGFSEISRAIDHASDAHHLVSAMQHLEKEINNRHKELLPLSDKIEETSLKKQKALNKLEIDLQKETSVCKSFEHRTDRIYESVRARMTDSIMSTKDLYQRLSSEVYVTETVLNDVLDAIKDDDALSDRHFVESQQALLDLMTAFYNDQTRTEVWMMRDLSRMTTLLEKGVDATFKVKHKALSNSLSRMTSSFSSRRESLKNTLSKTLLSLSAAHQKSMSETEKSIRDLESAIASSEPTLKEQLKIVSDNSEAIAIQVDKDHIDNEALRDADAQKAIHKVDQSWIQSTRDLEALEETIRTRNQLIIARADQQITKQRVQMRQKHEQIMNEEHKSRINLEHRMKDFERESRRLGERREESLKNLLKHHRRFRNQSEKQQQRVQRREIRILRKSYQFKLKMLHLN